MIMIKFADNKVESSKAYFTKVGKTVIKWKLWSFFVEIAVLKYADISNMFTGQKAIS